MIKTVTKFSHGVFTIYVKPEEQFGPNDEPLVINDFHVYVFNRNAAGASDPYIDEVTDLAEGATQNGPGGTLFASVRFNDPPGQHQDRLIKWTIVVDRYSGNNHLLPQPCCADLDSQQNYVFEGYAVDLTNYELDILRSINLNCHDCEVPKSLLTNILKLEAVRAAVESKSPYLEMMFSKIACQSSYNHIVNSFSRGGCGCNG